MITWLLIFAAAIIVVYLLFYRARIAAKMDAAPRKPEELLAKPGQPSKQLDFELPGSYGRDKIVTMVRDPEWIYAYWELSPAKRKWFEKEFGRYSWESSQSLLRIYDLTASTSETVEQSPYFDIDINDCANNWYIHVGKPNHKLQVDVGRRLPDNTFITLARSNVVLTPNNAISGVIDPLWPPNELVWQTLTRTGKLVLPSGHTFQLVQRIEAKG